MKRREKDTASSVKLVSIIGASACPKRGTEPGVRKGKRSLLARNSVKVKPGIKVMKIGGKSDRFGSHCNWSMVRMAFNIRERETSYVYIIINIKAF